MSNIALIALMCCLGSVPLISASCCGNPWVSCCGDCNAFCCNCDIQEQSMDYSTSSVERFDLIDVDNNGYLDHYEALAWLEHKRPTNNIEKFRAHGVPKWFKLMDRDGDKMISPIEFDKDYYNDQKE